MKPKVKYLPCGDTALAVEFGDRIDRRLSASVVGLGRRINEIRPDGLVETVPTFRSLLVHYDPLKTSASRLIAQIDTLLEAGADEQSTGRLWRVPACYQGDLAPDLEEVASRTGLTPSEVVAGHTVERYYVYMLGFLPGFPYMGDLPEPLQLPRRENPRVKVPAGSVAIALNMTAVYSFESPGGWHLIGRTPIGLFSLDRTPPALVQPGDAVCFEAISRAEFDHLSYNAFVPVPEQLA
jgi:inhibitor of KinA